MSRGRIFFVVGLVAVFGVGAAVGAARVAKHEQADARSLPRHATEFLRECGHAVRERNGKEICRCLLANLESTLRTDHEYKLANAIIAAIIESGPNRARMQSKFNQISQNFHDRVSIERKASVLRAVTTEGVSCGKAHRA